MTHPEAVNGSSLYVAEIGRYSVKKGGVETYPVKASFHRYLKEEGNQKTSKLQNFHADRNAKIENPNDSLARSLNPQPIKPIHLKAFARLTRLSCPVLTVPRAIFSRISRDLSHFPAS